MSNKELDNLFKNKLGELEKQPSPMAWDRIQAQTPKQAKSNTWLYSGIAAAIVLLIAFAGLFYVNQTGEHIGSHIAMDQDSISEEEAHHEQPSILEQPAIVDDQQYTGAKSSSNQALPKAVDEENMRKRPVDTKKQAYAANQMATASHTTQENNSIDHINQKDEQMALQPQFAKVAVTNNTVDTHTEIEKIINDDATVQDAIASSNHETKTKKGLTLTFNIEDFKKPAVVVTEVSEDEKKSTLRKVIEMAKDIKDEAGLADLRAAKNELFALNFTKTNDNKSK